MKKTFLFSILFAAVLCTSCKVDEIDTFPELNSENYIYFYNPSFSFNNLYFGSRESVVDSMEVSFFSYPGQDEVTVYLPVCRAGYSEEDTKFKVSVVAEESTATASDYSIAELQTFPGGEQTTTFPVILKRTAKMETDTLRLVVRLVDGGDYKSGPVHQVTRIINFHGQVVKPDWWANFKNADGNYVYVQNRALGPFSLRKYEIFMNIAEGYEFSVETPLSIFQYYALKMKEYLRAKELAGTPELDEDGKVITVPIGGN